MDKPWKFNWDSNQDNLFTISDIFDWLQQLYFLPGDTFLYFIINIFPTLAQFFEISVIWHHGFFSGFVSFVFWLFFVLVIVITYFSSVEMVKEKLSDRVKYRHLNSIQKYRKKMGYDNDE